MIVRRSISSLVAAALVAWGGMGGRAPAQGEGGGAPEATRYAVLDLGRGRDELIGVHITDEAVGGALERIPAGLGPDVLVLRFQTPGGMLREVPDLVDLIAREVERGVRVVAWVERAESAGALVAMGCPEIVMTPGGTIGAALTYKMERGEAVALEGEELERALLVGAEVARRTGRDARVIRAMQTPTALSYDVDADGRVVLRDDTRGERILCDERTVLTLNSKTAETIGVSIGTARSIDEVLALLGVERGRDVGRLASVHLLGRLAAASVALARMDALDRGVRRAIDAARDAASEEARAREVRRASELLERLVREAESWPDVAAYLRVDEVRLGLYEEDVAALGEGARAPD